MVSALCDPSATACQSLSWMIMLKIRRHFKLDRLIDVVNDYEISVLDIVFIFCFGFVDEMDKLGTGSIHNL